MGGNEKAHRWVREWRRRLGIACPVRLERTSIWQVTDERGRRGCSLVGVALNRNEACIFHTRRLTEEDIVHELLHVAFPQWREEEIIAETRRLLAGRDQRPRRSVASALGGRCASVRRRRSQTTVSVSASRFASVLRGEVNSSST